MRGVRGGAGWGVGGRTLWIEKRASSEGAPFALRYRLVAKKTVHVNLGIRRPVPVLWPS